MTNTQVLTQMIIPLTASDLNELEEKLLNLNQIEDSDMVDAIYTCVVLHYLFDTWDESGLDDLCVLTAQGDDYDRYRRRLMFLERSNGPNPYEIQHVRCSDQRQFLQNLINYQSWIPKVAANQSSSTIDGKTNYWAMRPGRNFFNDDENSWGNACFDEQSFEIIANVDMAFPAILVVEKTQKSVRIAVVTGNGGPVDKTVCNIYDLHRAIREHRDNIAMLIAGYIRSGWNWYGARPGVGKL